MFLIMPVFEPQAVLASKSMVCDYRSPENKDEYGRQLGLFITESKILFKSIESLSFQPLFYNRTAPNATKDELIAHQKAISISLDY